MTEDLQIGGFIIRDSEDIRPARPIPQKEINQLLERFEQLGRFENFWDQFEEMMEIGFKLRCWHDLFDSEAQWNHWRRRFLKRIPIKTIGLCLKAWDQNEKIKNYMRRRGIPIKTWDPAKYWNINPSC